MKHPWTNVGKIERFKTVLLSIIRRLKGEKVLDYLTGEMHTASYLHSKKIRNEGDGAKLISSNDESNFTFRGRFSQKEQAFAIGSVTSQKNA